jgi:hypothetical protein
MPSTTILPTLGSAPKADLPSPTTFAVEAELTPSPTVATCSPLEIDAYKAAALPVLDEMAVASREAIQLAELSADRVGMLIETSQAARDKLATIGPPGCLQAAHEAALEGASLLVRALEAIGSGDYPLAETTLRDYFGKTAEAVALLGLQIWETTATTTSSP